ncbi:MAG TPA: ATP-binding protein [Burkholderiaceae bacterium]|nr:ATP-binding protein [Burkholderiaceae bacterium]
MTYQLAPIRRRALQMLAAVMLPAVIACAITVYVLHREGVQTFQRGVQEATRAIALVVDREILRREELLKTLATSPALDHNDLQGFHDQASRIASSFDKTIVLMDTFGRQLLNTRVPLGAPLEPSAGFKERRERIGPLATSVTDLYFAPIGKQYSFAVEVPVVRQGRVVGYLAMGSFVSHLQQVFSDQQLPPSWTGSLIDGTGAIMARSRDWEKMVGRRATADMLESIARSREGFLDTKTLAGESVRTYFRNSSLSGWTLLVGVPEREIDWVARPALIAMTALLVLLFAVAGVVSIWVRRRIAQPIQALAAAAHQVGSGQLTVLPTHGVREIADVASALIEADIKIRASNDVLERRVNKAVEETRLAQDALLSSQKLEALGRLTGGIAHDFNNLLQVLTSGLYLLQRLVGEDVGRRAAESCLRAVERGAKLTRQLMTFGKAQPGQRSVVKVGAVVQGMHELLRGALPAIVELRVAIDDDVAPVFVDAVQFELAILNLVFNARDAMPRGGRIEISASSRIAPGDDAPPRLTPGSYVVVDIKDTGTGMAPDVIRHAFEPFFTTKPVGEGTGLGLAQVYGFAAQSAGAATIDSVLGQGTRIALWLPAATGAAISHAPQISSAATTARNAHVLMVEDDELVASVVKPALEDRGYRIELATSADQALAWLRSGDKFDLVFSDIVMPGTLNGLGLASEVRKQWPRMPVVLASGYAATLGESPDAIVLRKPYTPDTLIETFDRVLAEQSTR